MEIHVVNDFIAGIGFGPAVVVVTNIGGETDIASGLGRVGRAEDASGVGRLGAANECLECIVEVD